jgi:hypothetical protein
MKPKFCSHLSKALKAKLALVPRFYFVLETLNCIEGTTSLWQNFESVVLFITKVLFVISQQGNKNKCFKSSQTKEWPIHKKITFQFKQKF